MKYLKRLVLLPAYLIMVFFNIAIAQNPIVRNQYSADPSQGFSEAGYMFIHHTIFWLQKAKAG